MHCCSTKCYKKLTSECPVPALFAPALTFRIQNEGGTVTAETIFVILLLCAVASLTVVATTTLCWMLFAWRDDVGVQDESLAAPHLRMGELTFSLLVPARHEELVLERTLRTLAATTHPLVEIIAVVSDDDHATRAVADRVAASIPMVRVVIDSSVKRSKPASLNTGLLACRGDVVGVFDAEDQVHPELLGMVEHRMLAQDLDVLQAGVQLMNYWSSWFAVRNVLEYFFWFRSRLHFQASHNFVPLGGNTVFVKRELLESVGGWDPTCLAEDCDLGVRLSVKGAKIGVVYDSALVTREEVPTSVREFVRQRTRWSQGFIQVYRKRDWAALPTRRRRIFARYVLLSPLFQAIAGIVVPISIATAFVAKIPSGLALLTWLPTLPTVATIAVELVILGEFCRIYGGKPKLRDRLRLIIGAPFYQVLLGVAAVRASLREARGSTGWEKTLHVGNHLDDEPAEIGIPEQVHTVVLDEDRVIVLPDALVDHDGLAEPAMSRGL
jgi:cellulose synthase/poly-beta-1,6-N-acetylglucosamine synthase-like glycosyltransferase